MTCDSLHISPAGINLIKHFQGLSLEKYRDESGLWVIGYGHILSPVDRFGDIISPSHAEKLFHADIAICERFLQQVMPAPLEQYQYDALISLIFSCGIARVTQSGILDEIAQNNDEKAIDIWRNEQILNGKNIPSLAALRQAECDLFLMKDIVEA